MIHSAINNASIATASVHPIENGSVRTRAMSFVVYGIILAAEECVIKFIVKLHMLALTLTFLQTN